MIHRVVSLAVLFLVQSSIAQDTDSAKHSRALVVDTLTLRIKIDSLTALRIARDGGLKEGIQPVHALLFNITGDKAFWLIRNILEEAEGEERGQQFRIDASTGEIIENVFWMKNE